MTCPKCQGQESRVTDKREGGNGLRRRRMCCACGYRWTTYEVTADRITDLAAKNTKRQCLRILKSAYEAIRALQTAE